MPILNRMIFCIILNCKRIFFRMKTTNTTVPPIGWQNTSHARSCNEEIDPVSTEYEFGKSTWMNTIWYSFYDKHSLADAQYSTPKRHSQPNSPGIKTFQHISQTITLLFPYKSQSIFERMGNGETSSSRKAIAIKLIWKQVSQSKNYPKSLIVIILRS